jgi:hypothetical protein
LSEEANKKILEDKKNGEAAKSVADTAYEILYQRMK